ncbi:MAG: DNA translocase FtsK [Gaiellales bacterium]
MFADDESGEPTIALGAIAQPRRLHKDYKLPDASVLKQSQAAEIEQGTLDRMGQTLVEALESFGVKSRVIGTVSGPRVTRYEIQLAPGTKVGRVSALKDDLAYALATTDIRILAPIPGKQAVGVEVPNTSPNLVTLGDIQGAFPAGCSPLTVWLGKDISGNHVHADLAKMPHVLIAGTTGSGKSGSLNAMLVSILLNSTPDEVKMILIDPKRVELNHYEAIPHLLTPVVTNMKSAAAALMNVVGEMERRYEKLGAARSRNIVEFNKARIAAGREDDTLPYVLVVIDELADLMMVSPAEVEDCIIRLAQKSRAVGIHLVLATQRPSVDVITGMIKANVPSRVAFAVSSMTDSRVILDTPGAESLLGQGDMLYRPIGTSRIQRIQGAYVGEDEVALVVEQCRNQAEPEFEEGFLDMPQTVAGVGGSADADDDTDPDSDPLLEDALRVVCNHETASVSLLQRRLRVGYTRAGRLIDMLERRGAISGYEGSKPRQVLITEGDIPRLMSGGTTAAPVPAGGDEPPWSDDDDGA